MEHECKCCGGTRPHNGEICLGCGTPLLKCKPSARPKRITQTCPNCASDGPHDVPEANRFRCRKCNSIFEFGDFGFVDDRPDVNVEKKEQLERDQKGRKP